MCDRHPLKLPVHECCEVSPGVMLCVWCRKRFRYEDWLRSSNPPPILNIEDND